MRNGECQETLKEAPLNYISEYGEKQVFPVPNFSIASSTIGFIADQKLTNISQDLLKKKLSKKLNNWLETRAEIILDSDEYCGGDMTYEEAIEEAIEELRDDFDRIDERSELIEICKEDEPELWAYQKDIFNQLIKNL